MRLSIALVDAGFRMLEVAVEPSAELVVAVDNVRLDVVVAADDGVAYRHTAAWVAAAAGIGYDGGAAEVGDAVVVVARSSAATSPWSMAPMALRLPCAWCR